MSQAGCSGPQCTFTGTAADSKATPGRCTGTGGYLSNAEILEIIADRRRSGRVNANYIDPDSHTNILVYDDTQWVGWMDDDVKMSRTKIYRNFMFGGTADWATDLRTYNPPPGRSESWPFYISAVNRGVDPGAGGDTKVDWTTLDCRHPAVADMDKYTPSERWTMLGCGDAFRDAVNIWKNDHSTKSFTFTGSIGKTFRAPSGPQCGTHDACGPFLQCDNFRGDGTGPAAYEVWNSMVLLNKVNTPTSCVAHAAQPRTIGMALTPLSSVVLSIPGRIGRRSGYRDR
jgi:hypothetical protein